MGEKLKIGELREVEDLDAFVAELRSSAQGYVDGVNSGKFPFTPSTIGWIRSSLRLIQALEKAGKL